MSDYIDIKLPKTDHVRSAEQARDLAIEWQSWQAGHDLSYGEVVYYQNYFEALATRFNLTHEFLENGVL